MAPPVPNPVHAVMTIRFGLPSAGPANLAVFDVQGRRVASLLDHVSIPAGPNQLTVSVDSWSEGFYFCRLDANETSTTAQYVVLR